MKGFTCPPGCRTPDSIQQQIIIPQEICQSVPEQSTSNQMAEHPLLHSIKAMDTVLHPIASLGRPSGCGMPGTVSPGSLSILLQEAMSNLPQEPCWKFLDLGAGYGRMLFAAAMLGASQAVGLEICDLTHTFNASRELLYKKGVLSEQQANNCKLVIGDAVKFQSVQDLVGPGVDAPVMASLVDEGIPLCIREHLYARLADDPRVQVVLTVNYRGRESHLPHILTDRGFLKVKEMAAPLSGHSCHTTGRIYVRHMKCRRSPRLHSVVPAAMGHMVQMSIEVSAPAAPKPAAATSANPMSEPMEE